MSKAPAISQREYKEMLDTLDQGLVIFDSNKALVFINEEMSKIWRPASSSGVTVEEFLRGHRLYDETGNHVPVEKCPITLAFEKGIETHDLILEHIDVLGKHSWLKFSSKKTIDAKGKLTHVCISVRNISRRKSNERKLKFLIESAKILNIKSDFRERLLEKAKLIVPELADWAMITVKNDDAMECVALVHRDMEKRNAFEEYFDAKPRGPITAFISRVIETQKPLFLPVVSDDFLRRYVISEDERHKIREFGVRSLMIIPIAPRGRGLGALVLAHADSDRIYSIDDFEFFQEFCYHLGSVFESAHYLEEIERRDRVKDLFLATLSHELRNPLSPIKSALELIKIAGTHQNTSGEMDIIEHNVDHLAKLLDDLLEVSRLTRGLITLECADTDLRQTLLRTMKSMEVLSAKAGIELHVQVPDERVMVHGDETRLEQAITNLLSNSLKFTPRGGIISVTLRVSEDETTISIRDTGIGIAPEEIGKIFSGFYQVNISKKANGGLGLGLLLVDRIVRLHKGAVRASSEGIGLGSEFTLRLPVLPQTVSA